MGPRHEIIHALLTHKYFPNSHQSKGYKTLLENHFFYAQHLMALTDWIIMGAPSLKPIFISLVGSSTPAANSHIAWIRREGLQAEAKWTSSSPWSTRGEQLGPCLPEQLVCMAGEATPAGGLDKHLGQLRSWLEAGEMRRWQSRMWTEGY